MIVYTVAPAQNVWVVRLSGNSQSEAFPSKADAVRRARELADKNQGVVRVLDATGGIEQEYGPPARP